MSGLATVVFVDVEGSTTLMECVGDDAGTDAVGRQLDRVRERVETYGAREVQSKRCPPTRSIDTIAAPREQLAVRLRTVR